jgi:hypothetical protein
MSNEDDGLGLGTMGKFMEISMGLGLGRQMVNMMNESMPARPSDPQASDRTYYAAFEGKQAGPFSETEIVRLINDKKIVKETYVWRQGMSQWKPAQEVPEILRIFALSPPALPPQTT